MMQLVLYYYYVHVVVVYLALLPTKQVISTVEVLNVVLVNTSSITGSANK